MWNVIWYTSYRFAGVLNNCDFNTTSNDLYSCQSDTALPVVPATDATVKEILQILFGLLGFVAVVIIIFAGYRYMTSQGNPDAHKQAWKTIMYASVGLAVALLAEAIVSLALRRVG